MRDLKRNDIQVSMLIRQKDYIKTQMPRSCNQVKPNNKLFMHHIHIDILYLKTFIYKYVYVE